MTKQEIYNYLKQHPEHVLCELTKDDFQLTKVFDVNYFVRSASIILAG